MLPVVPESDQDVGLHLEGEGLEETLQRFADENEDDLLVPHQLGLVQGLQEVLETGDERGVGGLDGDV